MMARDASISGPAHDSSWPPNWPPSGETEQERSTREHLERIAKQVSDEIDHGLDQDRKELKKRELQTKLLLLGQSEAGKSTLLKNLQMYLTPKAFEAESIAWRSVIHLNLCRSINFLLDCIDDGMASPPMSPIDRPISFSARPPRTPSIQMGSSEDDIRRLRMRLSPLRQVEEALSKRLNVSKKLQMQGESRRGQHEREVFVRSGSQWKAMVGIEHRRNKTGVDELEETRNIITACREDIATLWSHPALRSAMKDKKVTLEEQAEYFLDAADRVAARDYRPTSVDILRARLQTMGVEEHRLVMENETLTRDPEWIVYDVGGTRSQRPAWAPFFENVSTVLFMAPVSAFNEVLVEDRTVYRLADSISLWKKISSNTLLTRIPIILMMNKVDLLKQKLEAGVQFSKYVTTYHGENTLADVQIYLLKNFKGIHAKNSPKTRKLFYFFCSAIDYDEMCDVLFQVKEIVLVRNLKQTDVL